MREKVSLDTEVRKLDMLRSAHLNQQHEISKAVKNLSDRIENSTKYRAGLLEDRATRDAHAGEFTMTVEDRAFSGKNAREEAEKALIQAVMSSRWESGKELQLKRLGNYKGFVLMSSFSGREREIPRLYVRGKHTYESPI